MLMGSSYSIINSGVVTDEEYRFNVASFDVEFQDNKSISLNGLPISDEDGMKTSKEFTFVVNNNSDFDVNYRLDIIENGPYKMSDVIKYSYSINNSQYTDIHLLSDNYTIKQNKVLKSNSQDSYKIKMWLSIDADERYMNKKFSASISLVATHNENKYATNVLEYLNGHGQDNVVLDMGNLRYTKEEPNNYVWFNCMNNYTKGTDYCEKWRIIGSFKEKIQNNGEEYAFLKIMGNYLDNLSFGNNDLNGDFSNSYINTYLNGLYYDNLSDDTKALIWKGKWYIGNTKSNVYLTSYYDEQKVSTYANIGLLNVSDYLFLQNNSWIKNDKNILTINRYDDKVNIITNKGIRQEDIKKEVGIIPVVYLRSDVSIINGDGSFNNPYELQIKFPMNLGLRK